MPCDGTFPTGTTQYEKRSIAQDIPIWDPKICTQCGLCSLGCPHATIRMKAFDPALLAKAPAGFKAADYLDSIDVYGTGGRHLRDDWSDGAQAYLGTLVAGYPNFFMLYGPNTNGVNSIIYIHEAQTTFIRHILDVVGERGARTVAVTPDAQRRYNDEIQADIDAARKAG